MTCSGQLSPGTQHLVKEPSPIPAYTGKDMGSTTQQSLACLVDDRCHPRATTAGKVMEVTS